MPLVDRGRCPRRRRSASRSRSPRRCSARATTAGRRGRADRPRRHPPDRRSGWTQDGRRARPLRRLGHARRRGAWTFEMHAWSDPIATWQHDAGIKIPAGVDVELMFTEGALLLERVLAGLDAERAPGARRSCSGGDRRRRATPRARSRPGSPRWRPPEPERRCSRQHPLRELVTVEGPFPVYADRRARALRQLVRVLPPLRGRDARPADGQGRPAAPSRPPRSGSTPSPRWASTSSTCRRSTRSARSTARAPTTRSPPGPTTPARRGRSAARTAATTRSTPTSARSTTSTPSSRAPPSSGSRSRSTSRCRRRPTTRG